MPIGVSVEKTQAWRDMYNEHRGRLKQVRPHVDTGSPKLNIQSFFKASDLRQAIENYKRINNMNWDLLVKMNGFLRTEGVVRPWRSKPKEKLEFSKIYENTQRVKKIETENRQIGKLINDARAALNTRRSEDIRKERQRCETINLEALSKIMKKYTNCTITLPQEPKLLRHILRPTVFMDVSMPGIVGKNRIYIKLYTEACPEAVLEFMRIFKDEKAENIYFKRLYPNLWMEGHIDLSKKALRVGRTEYDKRVINHGSSGGILSIPKFLVNGCAKRNLVFYISFRPLPIINNESLGFGRICRGMRNWLHLKDNGFHNGTPIKPIVIEKLGILP